MKNLALLPLALLLLGCGESGPSTPASASAAGRTAPPAASDRPAAAPSPAASSSSSPAASASAAPAGAPSASGDLAAIFAGEVENPSAPAKGIMTSSQPSGAIVLVPAPFAPGSGVYGQGYMTGTGVGANVTSEVNLGVDRLTGASPALQVLSETTRVQLCYPVSVEKITWEAPVDVKLPAGSAAKVWKGAGSRLGTKKPWNALAVSTLLDKGLSVTGCGVWSAEAPEAEKGVVQVLKSIRLGTAGPTDPGNP